MVAILRTQPVAALLDRPNTAPLAIANLEDVFDQPPRGGVAIGADGPGIGIFDHCATRLELAYRPQNALEQVERLEASDHNRHAEIPCNRFVIAAADDSANVSGTEKALNAVIGRREKGLHHGGHHDV